MDTLTNPALTRRRLAWTPVARLMPVVIASLAALAISFCRVFAAFDPDSDIANPVVVLQGFEAHGLAFVRSWAFMQDNWLLSLLAPDALLFAVFGSDPLLVLATGWAILAANAALAAAILRRVTRRPEAWLLFPMLLLANQAAIGKVGFFGYPASHNISMLWGLIALWAGLAWLDTARAWLVALSGVALTVGAVSDPWLLPAMGLPAIMAAAALAPAAARPYRWRLAVLAATCLAAVALAHTRLLGVLGFLPPADFAPAHWPLMAENLLWELYVLARIFTPLPNQTLPLPGEPHAALASLTALLPLMVVLIWAALSLLRRLPRSSVPARFVALTAALSIGGTAAAFAIGSLPLAATNGRFFFNIWICAAMLAALAWLLPGSTVGRERWRGAVLALGAALVIAGVTDSPQSWARGFPGVKENQAVWLSRFLSANGLRYGYGAFWATDADSVAWLSRGHVIVRAVVFDPRTGHISRRFGQTSPFWYRPGDRPAGVTDTFVVVTRDLENCGDLAVCERGVRDQFGPPDRILKDGDMQVFVWDRVLPPPPSDP